MAGEDLGILDVDPRALQAGDERVAEGVEVGAGGRRVVVAAGLRDQERRVRCAQRSLAPFDAVATRLTADAAALARG